MHKRLLAAAFALLPLAASAADVQAVIDGKVVVFTDVPQHMWFAAYVRESAEAGIISGYRDARGTPTGKFGPSNDITVAEALKIVSEGAGYDETRYAARVNSGVQHWSASYVSVAKSEGFPVITDRIRLDRSATRAEMAAMLAAAFRVSTENVIPDARYDDVSANMTYAAAIEVLSRDRIVSGDMDGNGLSMRRFRPSDNINRAEVAKMIIEARAKYSRPGEGRLPSEDTGDKQSDGNVVTLTNDGFTPSVLRVRRGEQVTFKNESSGQLWVASDPHPTHTNLAGFDAGRASTPGELFIFNFNYAGSFTFHNHLNPAQKGTVIVE